jgi:hypothetical protein
MEKDRSLSFVNSKEIEEPQIFGIHHFYLVTLNPDNSSRCGISQGREISQRL